jgi:hypothetical protein
MSARMLVQICVVDMTVASWAYVRGWDVGAVVFCGWDMTVLVLFCSVDVDMTVACMFMAGILVIFCSVDADMTVVPMFMAGMNVVVRPMFVGVGGTLVL